MKLNKFVALVTLGFLSVYLSEAAVSGWTNWRGPHQNGVTDEKGLPDTIDPKKNLLWSYEIAGRGTPVVADGKVYAWGYKGKGPDLQEVLVCLSEANGKLQWEHGYNDYLSDTVYSLSLIHI